MHAERFLAEETFQILTWLGQELFGFSFEFDQDHLRCWHKPLFCREKNKKNKQLLKFIASTRYKKISTFWYCFSTDFEAARFSIMEEKSVVSKTWCLLLLQRRLLGACVFDWIKQEPLLLCNNLVKTCFRKSSPTRQPNQDRYKK